MVKVFNLHNIFGEEVKKSLSFIDSLLKYKTIFLNIEDNFCHFADVSVFSYFKYCVS